MTPGWRLPTQVEDATRTGSSLDAPSPCRFPRLQCGRRGSHNRVGLRDHRPQRQRRLPEGGAERPGARQLQRTREALERARLGSAQRDPSDPAPQAGRVQARLLGRLRHLQARRLEDLQGRLSPVRRPRPAVVRRRLQGGRRLLLGAPVLAADAAELRPQGDRRSSRSGSCACRTSAARCPCSRSS